MIIFIVLALIISSCDRTSLDVLTHGYVSMLNYAVLFLVLADYVCYAERRLWLATSAMLSNPYVCLAKLN